MFYICDDDDFTWGLLIFLSFLPPLLYTIWIRNTERCHREQWKPIFLCFLWGATIAVVAAFILEVILELPFTYSLSQAEMTPFLAAVVIAPVVEEFTKPLALRLKSVRNNLDELEDGLIYGAVAGLGFSATENLLYGYSFLSEGIVVIFGFNGNTKFWWLFASRLCNRIDGIWIWKNSDETFILIWVFYRILFSRFFFMGSIIFLSRMNFVGVISGFFLAFLFVIIAITLIRNKIRTLDEKTC